MQDPHAPHDAFVERLEEKIGREVRRRNTLAESRRWLPQWSLKPALGITALVIVSMVIGGAVVAAAYEAQSSEQRDQVAAGYERRAVLARDRLALAEQQLKTAEGQVAVGLGTQDAVFDARVKLAEAQSSLKVLALQLEEIRLTSREPVAEVSSPLVSGRDFVSERWGVEMSVPMAGLAAEQARVRSAEQRVQLGVIDPTEVDLAKARVIEMQTGIEAFQRKIDIRQRFLKGEYAAPMADLQVLLANAEQRRKALLPMLQLAEKTAAQLDERFKMGLVTAVQRGEAQLKVLQLRMELVDLEVQVAVVQKQIGQRRIK